MYLLEKELSKMIEQITIKDVVTTIFAKFPEFNDVMKDTTPSMWIISGKMSYYLSIKVPNQHEYGKALHVNVRAKFVNKEEKLIDYSVYPKKSEKKGRGKFISKSVARTINWRDNLCKEIQIGIQIYKQKLGIK